MRIDQFDHGEPRAIAAIAENTCCPNSTCVFTFYMCRSGGGGNDARLLRLAGRGSESMNCTGLSVNGLLLKVESTGMVVVHVFSGR